MTLVFASNNAHKLSEVRAILSRATILSLSDIGFYDDIEETGATLEENSAIKAEAVRAYLLAHPEIEVDGVFSDDTGLEIMALGGEPGVRTARWAGESHDDAANRGKALSSLSGVTDRRARFRTVITLIRGNRREQVEGVVPGTIATEEFGKGGFGYDPVFIPEGYDKTFAELPAQVKNTISHRARAVENLRKLLLLALLLISVCVRADWRYHLSYNDVTRVAIVDDKVYAIANGALFSVEKQSEKIRTFSPTDGLHGLGLSNMLYDASSGQLLLVYSSGKIDIKSGEDIVYVDGLYKKDMTASKTVNNITINNGIAYLSTDFGIVTCNIRKHEIVDTYYIGPNAAEAVVRDVVISGDSIYAFTDNWIASAALGDNLVDYRVWNRSASSSVQPDPSKGKIAKDTNGDIWTAEGEQGLKRQLAGSGEVFYYRPDAPLANTPYRMSFQQNRLFVVPGGRWASQYNHPGAVMIYDGSHWMNISADQISSVTGAQTLDFMNVAVDPADPNHFFVTSYGTGLYEFRDNEFYKFRIAGEDNLLCSAASNVYRYTRLDGARFDSESNLYLAQSAACTGHIVRLTPDGQWSSLLLKEEDGSPYFVPTPGIWLWDNRKSNIIYFPSTRSNTRLIIVDTKGTFSDDSDDRVVSRNKWVDQDGNEIVAESIYSIMQTSKGNLWIATDKGPIIIPSDVDMFTSDRCLRLRIDDGGEYILNGETVNEFLEDKDGHIWVATATNGVYVLSADASYMMAHYTAENVLLPSNAILSLALNPATNRIFVGTADGLVSYADSYDPINDVPPVRMEALRDSMDGAMFRWRLHPAFTETSKVSVGRTKVYALSSGSLFSVDKESEEIEIYTKQSGLTASSISRIAYNKEVGALLIVYFNGMMDILSDNGDIVNLQDLYLKSYTLSMNVHDIAMRGDKAYLAMTFGVVVVDMDRHEIADTYYIGEEAGDVDVRSLAITRDSLYAMGADSLLYRASFSDNIIDFAYWKSSPTTLNIKQLSVCDDRLYALAESSIFVWQNAEWKPFYVEREIEWMRVSENRLICQIKNWYLVRLSSRATIERLDAPYVSLDAEWDPTTSTYWQASLPLGLCRLSDFQGFRPNGPMDNNAFRMLFSGSRLYICPGTRWTDAGYKPGNVHIYDNGWGGYVSSSLSAAIQRSWHDVVSLAVNPADPEECYLASYGAGIIHMKNGSFVAHYDRYNSTLRPAVDGLSKPDEYIRVDGLYVDSLSNLWALNAGTAATTINVKSPDGRWKAYNIYSEGRRVEMTTPGPILADRRNAHFKWLIDQRSTPGIILHYDNATPFNGADDSAIKRSVLYDQDGLPVVLAEVRCLVQDLNNDIWVGTPSGIVIIRSTTDFMKDATCYRVKIPRNDGTDLADYLLGTEQVNCIFVDGGNRKWIGTETSGLYLVSDDGLQTLEHFTEINSPLPSNSVLCLAAHPTTGELFIGTSSGIASYRADASEPSEDFSAVYAFPNPVRPGFTGVITITGLMDNTTVTIIDGGGNAVCRTRSNGGIAVWDGKNQYGRRATTGVYTVLCNAGDGKSHAVTKILFVN